VFNDLNTLFKNIALRTSFALVRLKKTSCKGELKMASRRNVLTFGAVGILLATVLIVVVTVGPTILLAKAGTIDIKVTDAPVQDLSSLNITVDQFEVHQRETDQWMNVSITGGQVTFDLVRLRNITQDAAIGQIPPGNYTMIKMHVLSAVAQINGGEVITVTFPPNKLLIQVHFEVEEGQTTSIILDMQVDTIKIAANPQHNVSPVIKPTVIPPA